MEIRRAVADDSTHIASVLYDSFMEFKSLYSPEAFVATTPAAGEIRSRLNEGPVWVAVQSESIVGTVSTILKIEGLYIRSMAVLPAARGPVAGGQPGSAADGGSAAGGGHYLWRDGQRHGQQQRAGDCRALDLAVRHGVRAVGAASPLPGAGPAAEQSAVHTARLLRPDRPWAAHGLRGAGVRSGGTGRVSVVLAS